MIKQDGDWKEVDWQTALEYVAQRPEAQISARARRGQHRRAGVAAQHARRTVPAAEAGARPGQRQRRFPPAPVRFPRRRQAGRRAVARHADRRPRHAATACWSSAASCARTIRCSRSACARRRRRARRSTSLHASDDDLLMPVANKAIVAPVRWRASLAQIVKARGRGEKRAGARPTCAGVDASPTAQAHRREPRCRASARPCCSATARSSTRRRRSCMRWRRDRRADRRARSASSAKPPTASAATSPGALPGAGRPECRRRCWSSRARPTCCSTSSRSSTAHDPQQRDRGDAGGGARGRAVAVPAHARRIRRRAAADRAVHRDRRHLRQHRRPRAELQRRRSSRWARRARPGRCCACWATCSACRASTSTAAKQVRDEVLGGTATSPRGWTTSSEPSTRRQSAAAVGRTAAHRRRADLFRRSARAPRALAAADARCGGRRARGCKRRRLQQLGLQRRRHGAACSQGGGEARAAGRASTTRLPADCVRVAGRRIRSTGAARARCSAR